MTGSSATKKGAPQGPLDSSIFGQARIRNAMISA
jgi:hypothetical protein